MKTGERMPKPDFKFMGQQDDPELKNAEGRGFPRIYDGTKRSLLDDVRGFLEMVCQEDNGPAEYAAVADQLLKRIEGGER